MARWTGYWEITYRHPVDGVRKEWTKNHTLAAATSEAALTLRGRNPDLRYLQADGWELDDVKPATERAWRKFWSDLRKDQAAEKKAKEKRDG